MINSTCADRLIAAIIIMAFNNCFASDGDVSSHFLFRYLRSSLPTLCYQMPSVGDRNFTAWHVESFSMMLSGSLSCWSFSKVGWEFLKGDHKSFISVAGLFKRRVSVAVAARFLACSIFGCQNVGFSRSRTPHSSRTDEHTCTKDASMICCSSRRSALGHFFLL